MTYFYLATIISWATNLPPQFCRCLAAATNVLHPVGKGEKRAQCLRFCMFRNYLSSAGGSVETGMAVSSSIFCSPKSQGGLSSFQPDRRLFVGEQK